jgi:ribosomal protein S20
VHIILNLLNDEIDKITRKLESKEKQIGILQKELKLIEAKESMIDKLAQRGTIHKNKAAQT